MQVQNIGELVPGDVVVLYKEAKVMIGMMAENNVVWPTHHSQKVDYSVANFLSWMDWVAQWNPDPHKDGGVAYKTLCRATGAMKQTIDDETKNHQDLCFGDWGIGDTEDGKARVWKQWRGGEHQW